MKTGIADVSQARTAELYKIPVLGAADCEPIMHA